MNLQNPQANTACNELALIAQKLPLMSATVLELGCGTARMTRLIAERFPIKKLIATEVDSIQHAKNLASEHPKSIEFKAGGMQAIDLPDNSVDIVFMFKSLHHVPAKLMAQGMRELARVLKPGGLAWISEPVYAGEFNDIIRLFHDEKIVREQAFAALKQVVDSNFLELVEQIHCNTETRFANFNEFEQRIINVTHTDHKLSSVLYAEVQAKFNQHMTAEGAKFSNPARFDIVRKPLR
jgi:ubiquinone/menaquinone biosynthesis C-methylase UbiE